VCAGVGTVLWALLKVVEHQVVELHAQEAADAAAMRTALVAVADAVCAVAAGAAVGAEAGVYLRTVLALLKKAGNLRRPAVGECTEPPGFCPGATTIVVPISVGSRATMKAISWGEFNGFLGRRDGPNHADRLDRASRDLSACMPCDKPQAKKSPKHLKGKCTSISKCLNFNIEVSELQYRSTLIWDTIFNERCFNIEVHKYPSLRYRSPSILTPDIEVASFDIEETSTSKYFNIEVKLPYRGGKVPDGCALPESP
jgi:hypothetical protein